MRWETLQGTVERITYADEESGYTVIRLAVPGQRDLVTAVGNLLNVNVGESLRLEGRWTMHSRYGRQFRVERYQTVLPATVEGIRKYLGSGLVRGIGPVMAERIVKKFGTDTLRVIDEEPHRLREVLGIGPKRVAQIMAAWEEQRHIRDVMVFLQGHGVSPALAVKIYRAYGDQAIATVRTDPYRLARDIHGIGFITADRIARALGLPHDSPARIQAGIAHVLSELADQGHVYVPQEKLIAEAAKMLEVPPEQVAAALEELDTTDLIHREAIPQVIPSQSTSYQSTTYQPTTYQSIPTIREERAVYLVPFYRGEVGVARRLRTMLEMPQSRLAPFRSFNWDAAFALLDRELEHPLAPQQREAVRTALTNKVTVLTGGPGTGKTTTMRAVIRLLETQRRRYVLASPTGRAAKRLSEATGRPAKTVHRLLEYSPQDGFQRNEEHPLDADMVIVDEASMLDLLLTNHLLKAIPPDAHLLLVGDVDQLPSVGAGNVLQDIIASGRAAVVRLEVIFRQAADSLIVTNAHRINRGQMPVFNRKDGDFFFFGAEDPEQAAELTVDIVQRRIPRRFGFHPIDDVQVIAPMYRGEVGVSGLNARLQAALNPPGPGKPERRIGGRVFRLGDKVMQTRNNYDKDVYNGDIGRIVRLDLINQRAVVRFDEREVVYDFTELDEVVHAYCISVHKSQGSEYRAVVMPVLTQHYMMLQRNLLYTAVTRARELVVLVGTKRAIAIAVKNNRVAQRYSGLQVRLTEM